MNQPTKFVFDGPYNLRKALYDIAATETEKRRAKNPEAKRVSASSLMAEIVLGDPRIKKILKK